jgi:hypothetical protein
VSESDREGSHTILVNDLLVLDMEMWIFACEACELEPGCVPLASFHIQDGRVTVSTLIEAMRTASQELLGSVSTTSTTKKKEPSLADYFAMISPASHTELKLPVQPADFGRFLEQMMRGNARMDAPSAAASLVSASSHANDIRRVAGRDDLEDEEEPEDRLWNLRLVHMLTQRQAEVTNSSKSAAAYEAERQAEQAEAYQVRGVKFARARKRYSFFPFHPTRYMLGCL